VRRWAASLLVLLALGGASAALNLGLSRALFDTNIVGSLLALSGETALGHALLGALFLLNRLWLDVAWPSLCALVASHAVFLRLCHFAGGQRRAVTPVQLRRETPGSGAAAQ